MERTAIDLFYLDQPALILLDPSGARYTNQSGGNLNAQLSETGILFPIRGKSSESGHCVGSLSWELGKICQDCEVGTEEAEKLDILLKEEVYFVDIRVDRSRLSQSMEAFVYVVARPIDSRTPEGLPPILLPDGEREAVLVWLNSD